MAVPDDVEVLPFCQIAWSMAQLRHRHRSARRQSSAAMVEALAAAHALDAAIAVSQLDVGPNLRGAARNDGIVLHIL